MSAAGTDWFGVMHLIEDADGRLVRYGYSIVVPLISEVGAWLYPPDDQFEEAWSDLRGARVYWREQLVGNTKLYAEHVLTAEEFDAAWDAAEMAEVPADIDEPGFHLAQSIDGEVWSYQELYGDGDDSRSFCIDCGMTLQPEDGPSEYFMVHDHVRDSVARENDGYRLLCVGCLEARLGRELTADDFSGAPINSMTWDTPRLAARKLKAAACDACGVAITCPGFGEDHLCTECKADVASGDLVAVEEAGEIMTADSDEGKVLIAIVEAQRAGFNIGTGAIADVTRLPDARVRTAHEALKRRGLIEWVPA